MENKLYYTPTIEEFHVGFECELRNSSGPIFEWEPFKIIGVDDGEISGNLMDWSFYDTRTAIKDEQIRVKYLDKSDIESLGFKYLNRSICHWYTLEGNFNIPYTCFKIVLCYCSFDKQLRIYGEDQGSEDQLFRGTIKNKSELIKLMQQLNIK